MIESTMSQAATAMRGELNGRDASFRGVSTDSRSLGDGELFIALAGPNFDGADFVGQAEARGAAGVVAQSAVRTGLPVIAVDNTRAALGRLAADWRARLRPTVIGVTGSNGKTTLKELLASCLRPIAATLATQGNLNNEIGVPLMLLRLSREHRYAVLEMGANHAGEIAYLTSLAAPGIVVISNAGPAHLEGFGSLDGVAHAKGEILQGKTRPMAAILNADDAYFDLWRSLAADVDIVSFGYSERATVRVSDVHAGEDGCTFELHLPVEHRPVRLPLPGAHNVVNACAAAAVALAAGLSGDQIRHGLENVRPVDGRLRPIAGIGGIQLYDDTYNANPTSVVAAAQFVAAQAGDAWMVLGDMGELGADAEGMHAAVGREIRKAGVKRLFATGALAQHSVAAFGDGGAWFETLDELVAELRSSLAGGARVLVKGSRFMRMERVVNALRGQAANDGGH